MKAFMLSVVAAVAIVSAANGGGAETASAALDQLKTAQFDKAIDGFSLAIGAGDMSKDDLEFAYYNRGIAELWKRRYQDAVSDFTISVHMVPKDQNAQDYLDFAQEYLDRKPPDMPVDLNTAVNNVVGTLFSTIVGNNSATQKWLEVSPVMQHCLAFKYGMEPIKLAERAITPANSMLNTYIEGCQRLINEG